MIENTGTLQKKLLVKSIPYCAPEQLFYHFKELPFSLLLDSSLQQDAQGQYSFIAIDPIYRLTSKDGVNYVNGSPSHTPIFLLIQQLINDFKLQKHEDLPPFQTGVAGLFSYDLCQQLENVQNPKINDLDFNDMEIGIYDLVIAFDHQSKKNVDI